MPQLEPSTARLYVVRWIREDGRNAKHKHFSRAADATDFHDKLTSLGKTAAIYTTPVQWQPYDPSQEAGR